VDATTLPIPGFTHKNSAEGYIGEDYEGQPGQMTPMKRELSTENEPRANAESTVEGDD
jgi:formate dehydrogenase major subunit